MKKFYLTLGSIPMLFLALYIGLIFVQNRFSHGAVVTFEVANAALTTDVPVASPNASSDITTDNLQTASPDVPTDNSPTASSDDSADNSPDVSPSIPPASSLPVSTSAPKSNFSNRIYLVGDSTVAYYNDYNTATKDINGWGMHIDENLSGVTVTNLALGGRSARSFTYEDNYKTLINSVGQGDYVYIQFGHNDQNTNWPDVVTFCNLDMNSLDNTGKNSEGRYSFEWFIINKYVTVLKQKGATPILVTPICALAGNGDFTIWGHATYQQAMKDIAKTYNIPLIDMTTLTSNMYHALYTSQGAAATEKLHAHEKNNGNLDRTHLSSYGASIEGKMIVDESKSLGLF